MTNNIIDKLDGNSLNLEKENIAKIKQLFPQAVTEGHIDFDKLRLILGDEVDESNEKYQFTWNGKSKTIKLAQSPSSATLRPSKEGSKDWDSTENLYIEGDNLEVLKQLQKTYFGKIRMIYIDPPYNTGGDFVYKDDFKDSIKNYKEQTNQMNRSNADTSGRYHTDWLNMMYSRLLLAKNLMSKDGLIFISIDDNEIENILKVGKELFGDANHVATFIWKSKPQGGNDNTLVVSEHEYIVVFSKSYNEVKIKGRKLEKNKYRLTDDFYEERGGYHRTKLDLSVLPYRYNLDYPIKCPDGTVVYPGGVSEEQWRKRKEGNNNDHDWRWRWSQDRFEKGVENGHVEFIKKNSSWTVYTKEYEFVDNDGKQIDRLAKHRTVINDLTNVDGTKEIKSIFSQRLFSYPKPTNLISKFIDMLSQDSIVLDFFSGSSTTAHSTMELNAKDGGNRKFIMVQLPEKTDEKSEAYKAGYKNICEIGKERIRRAGEKIKQDIEKEGKDSSGLDVGFKVFKLDDTNIKEWDSSVEVTKQTLLDHLDVIKDDRNNEDVLYETLLKYGVFDMPVKEINLNYKTVYDVGEGYMIVSLNDEIGFDDVKTIGERKPHVVIFKESAFEDDNAKINALHTLEKMGIADVKSI